MTTVKLEYKGNGKFETTGNFWIDVCTNNFRQGQIIEFTSIKPRSVKHHKWWFAIVKKSWHSLPDHLVKRWPSPEHFRKALLCMVGHCYVSQHVYSTKSDANNAALQARFCDDYLIVAVDDNKLHLMSAKSQSFNRQDQAKFRTVIEAALNELASILGCNPTDLLTDISGVPAWVTAPDME